MRLFISDDEKFSKSLKYVDMMRQTKTKINHFKEKINDESNQRMSISLEERDFRYHAQDFKKTRLSKGIIRTKTYN